MSCTSDKQYQAALALGLLWGMGRPMYPILTFEQRVEKTKVLFELMGLNLPISALPDGIQIGDMVCAPTSTLGWRTLPNFNSAMFSLEHIYKTFPALLTDIIKDQFLRQLNTFFQGQGISDMPTADKAAPEILKKFNAQIAQSLFLHHPIALSDVKIIGGSHFLTAENSSCHGTGLEENLYSAMREALFSASKSYVGAASREYEPILGLDTAVGGSPYLSNSVFNVAYVDEPTAQLLGEAGPGWYLIQHNTQPYEGPFENPARAVDWVRKEWGTQFEYFGAIAMIDTRMKPLRRQYEREKAKILAGSMSQVAKRNRLKALTEQFEFQVEKVIAPLILSRKPHEHIPDYIDFSLRSDDPNAPYSVVIQKNHKKSERLSWTVYRGGKLVDTGGPSIINEASREHNTPYDLLGYVVTRLMSKDHYALPTSL